MHLRNIYFYLLSLLEGTYTLRILQAFFELLSKIGPYFLFSIVIHVILLRFVQTRRISFNTKHEFVATLTAAIIGILSPMPTYAAVPVGLSLISLGVSSRAVTAFIIASPLMNPSVFFLTATQIGIWLAVARVITAFLLAVGGGWFSERFFTLPEKAFGEAHKEQCAPERSFWASSYRTFLFLGKYFAIALLISAAIKALVSPEWIAQILGARMQRSLLLAIALGVPFYSCGGAAIPIITVLREMGMNEGAVLAFFIAGPATKLETLYIYKSLLGIKVFIFYLLLTCVGAYLSGLILLIVR
jgi:uncharacterized membrane protein YraQ (UPF0718 family)